MPGTSLDRHVVIVGASLAGTRTAQGLRARGHTGPITLVGAEVELPYDRPPLSKALLKGDWSEANVESTRLLRPAEVDELGLDLRLGLAATGVDPAAHQVHLADGTSLGYDVLIIATGASARPSPWRPSSGVYQLRTLDDARAIALQLARKEPIIVVGGGFIGTEIAAAALERGCPVTVVDPLPEPMARLVGPEIAGLLVDLHVRGGAQTRFGVGVTGIEGQAGAIEVILEGGERLSAAAAVVGIGSIPGTEWLTGSGLKLDNGVLTDGSLRAIGVEDIYAVGDVARWPHPGRGMSVRAEHWTNASDQARHLAAVLTGGAAADYQPSDYVWSDQFDWKVNAVGWRDPDGTSVVIGDLTDGRRAAVVHADANGRACGVVTVNWVKALNQARKLLGAGERADIVAEALARLA